MRSPQSARASTTITSSNFAISTWELAEQTQTLWALLQVCFMNSKVIGFEPTVSGFRCHQSVLFCLILQFFPCTRRYPCSIVGPAGRAGTDDKPGQPWGFFTAPLSDNFLSVADSVSWPNRPCATFLRIGFGSSPTGQSCHERTAGNHAP